MSRVGDLSEEREDAVLDRLEFKSEPFRFCDFDFVNIRPEDEGDDSACTDDAISEAEQDDDVTGDGTVSDMGEMESESQDPLALTDDTLPPAKKQRTESSKRERRDLHPAYSGQVKALDIAENLREKVATQLNGKTAVQFFEKIFSSEVFQLLQTETLRYARKVKNDELFSLSDDDLKTFIGILLHTGYSPLPDEEIYWSTDDDLSRPFIRQAMSWTQYRKIKLYLRGSNQRTSRDSVSKVLTLMNIMNRNFQQFGIFDRKLTVDVMLEACYRRSTLKRFDRFEPMHFPYNMWAMCGNDGFCYKFDFFNRRDLSSEASNEALAKQVAQGVMRVMSDPAAHEVFLGSRFTCKSVLALLKARGIRATGIVDEKKSLTSYVTKKKKKENAKRGSCEQRFDTSTGVLLVKWQDHKTINIMTNYDIADPSESSLHDQHGRTSEKSIQLSKPPVLDNYFSGNGGVDLHEQLRGEFEVSIRRRSYDSCLIFRMLDMAVANSYILCKTAGGSTDGQISLLDFRRELARTYIRRAVRKREAIRSPSFPGVVPYRVRFEGEGHAILPSGSRRKCNREGCRSLTDKRCFKCGVHLCLKCFTAYHQRLPA